MNNRTCGRVLFTLAARSPTFRRWHRTRVACRLQSMLYRNDDIFELHTVLLSEGDANSIAVCGMCGHRQALKFTGQFSEHCERCGERRRASAVSEGNFTSLRRIRWQHFLTENFNGFSVAQTKNALAF